MKIEIHPSYRQLWCSEFELVSGEKDFLLMSALGQANMLGLEGQRITNIETRTLSDHGGDGYMVRLFFQPGDPRQKRMEDLG